MRYIGGPSAPHARPTAPGFPVSRQAGDAFRRSEQRAQENRDDSLPLSSRAPQATMRHQRLTRPGTTSSWLDMSVLGNEPLASHMAEPGFCGPLHRCRSACCIATASAEVWRGQLPLSSGADRAQMPSHRQRGSLSQPSAAARCPGRHPTASRPKGARRRTPCAGSTPIRTDTAQGPASLNDAGPCARRTPSEGDAAVISERAAPWRTP